MTANAKMTAIAWQNTQIGALVTVKGQVTNAPLGSRHQGSDLCTSKRLEFLYLVDQTTWKKHIVVHKVQPRETSVTFKQQQQIRTRRFP